MTMNRMTPVVTQLMVGMMRVNTQVKVRMMRRVEMRRITIQMRLKTKTYNRKTLACNIKVHVIERWP